MSANDPSAERLMAEPLRAPTTIRPARREDARDMSRLYEQAYKPQGGGDARNHYPFPQFLEPEWMADSVADNGKFWVVADEGGNIVGVAGTTRNIGSEDDSVAEIFGIVVREAWQGRGVGSGLLGRLCQELEDTSEFVICESRTATAAGWRLARRCGFQALGFEPFAHATPAGSEAMLLTGKVAHDAGVRREATVGISTSVYRLAEPVLQSLGLPGTPQTPSQAYPLRPEPWSSLRVLLVPRLETPAAREWQRIAPDALLQVRRDDSSGPLFLRRWGDRALHDSGIVGLRRLEGQDLHDRRYDRQYYLACVDGCELACLRVVWDRIDCRARILEMHTRIQGLQGILLDAAVQRLQQWAGGGPMTVVVDVRVDDRRLHATLDELGFWPTVYYPNLIAGNGRRLDAVQYTRLLHCSFDHSLSCVASIEWPAAKTVIERTRQLHNLRGAVSPKPR